MQQLCSADTDESYRATQAQARRIRLAPQSSARTFHSHRPSVQPPSGNLAFLVANCGDGESRRLDACAGEADAFDAAEKLVKRLDARDYVAASMARAQAIDYADAGKSLEPFGVTVRDATSAVALCLKSVGDLANLHAAVKFSRERHKPADCNKKAGNATMADIRHAMRAGSTREGEFNLTKIECWLLVQVKEIVAFEAELASAKN